MQIGSLMPILVNGLAGVVVAAVSIWLSIILRRITKRLLSFFNSTIAAYVATVLQFIIWVLGAAATVIVADVNLAVILTVVALLSAGFSLALDGTMSDMIAGGKILMMGNLKVGDFVEIGDFFGEVCDLNAFNTALLTNNGTKVTISNSTVLSSILVNHTRGGVLWLTVKIPFLYDRDPIEAKMLISEVIRSVFTVIPDIYHTWVVAGDSYIQEFSILIPLESGSNRNEIASNVSLEVTDALNRWAKL